MLTLRSPSFAGGSTKNMTANAAAVTTAASITALCGPKCASCGREQFSALKSASMADRVNAHDLSGFETDSTVGQNESDLVDAGSLLRLSWHQNRVRVKSDFGRRINVIGLSSPSAKNILLPFLRNECFARRSHPQEEGRLAIVTNVGGMRRTRQRRARGRIARRFRERSERARRTALKRTAKACGPGTRLLVSSRRRSYDAQPGASGHPFAGDGGKTNSSPGSAPSAVKTIRVRECRVIPVPPL